MSEDPNITRVGPEFTIGDHPSKPGAVDILARFAPVVGQAADATTTLVALHHGYSEGNPAVAMVAGSAPLFLALKLGFGVGMGLYVKKLQDQGHLGWARALGFISGAGGIVPAALNTRYLR